MLCEACECDPCDCSWGLDEFRGVLQERSTEAGEKHNLASTADRSPPESNSQVEDSQLRSKDQLFSTGLCSACRYAEQASNWDNHRSSRNHGDKNKGE